MLTPSHLEETTDAFLELLEPLKELSPGGGAYGNEAHYLEPEWETTFWGNNYAKLLEVKYAYDPTHLFDCWRCVGWRGAEE